MRGESCHEGSSSAPRAEREPLDLLLPDAEPEVLRHAERLTGFLRLLASDARARHASAVAIDLERARVELEVREGRRLARALSELVRAHLRAHLGGATFLDLGAPAGDLEGAWRALLEARAELGSDAALPDPGEPAVAVARRLLRVLEGLLARPALARAPQGGLALLRAWLVRAERGPLAAEESCLEALEVLGTRAPAAARDPLVAAVAAFRLDRAAVREADLWLASHPGLVRGGPRRGAGELVRLLAWARLLMGDETGARRLTAAALRPAGPLPQVLVELRAARPAWLPLLAGRAPDADLARRALAAEPLEGAGGDLRRTRTALGAAVLAICSFDPTTGRAVRRLELAAGLRAQARAWVEGRENAHALSGEPEHRLLVEAQPLVLHREPGRPLRGALGERGSLALALAPLLGPAGDVEGWVHVECEHHLLPARARLARLAEALRPHLAPPATLHAGPRPGWSEAEDPSHAGVALVCESPDPARALCGRVFEGLVRALGLKTRERRWWGFEVDAGRPRLVAEGGEGLPGRLAGSREGGARALRRALASSGVVAFEVPDPGLSLHAGAASGVVVPLVVRGRCAGLFAVESRRRRDLGPAEAQRLRAAADGLALALRLAQMRSWHQERFGFDLCVDSSLPGLRAAAERAVAAGRSGEPALVVGPPGAGKSMLARWLHFEGAGEGATLGIVPLGHEEPDELERHLWTQGRGSVLLEPLEQASAALQQALLARLEGAGAGDRRGPRLLLVAGAPPRELAARGLVRADLAARLERLVLHVPPLADRREELVGLAGFLCERFAREEGTRPPRLEEGALALLWRQPWPGNVRQLESWLFELCLLHPDEEIGAGEVREAARRLRQPVLTKIHSRHPRRRDLVAALRSTLKKTGSVNKTRAASFLGWDPDTLVARLAEARLEEGDLAAEPWGW